MSDLVHGTTQCALCGWQLKEEIGLAIAQAKVGTRTEKQLTQIQQHLLRQHSRAIVSIDMYAAAYKGFMMLSQMRSTNPLIQEERDRMRWQIHAQTSNAS